jgi:predicted membrane protein
METFSNDKKQIGGTEYSGPDRPRPHHSKAGSIMGGIIIITVGTLLLARQMGVYFPEWLFSWEMLLIVFGVFIGAKHSFNNRGWLIPVFIGVVLLMDDFYPGLAMDQFIWPLLLIGVGVFMIFRPRSSHRWKEKWKERQAGCGVKGEVSVEDMLESVTVFGGIKKNIISKNFKGGEVVNIFGGSEINMSQADIQGTVELEVTQVFGGTKLIVPSNWEVKQEMVAIMGGIEDNRMQQPEGTVDHRKVLVIRGTSVFGGIDIKSF